MARESVGKYALRMAAVDVVERTDQDRYCHGGSSVGSYVFNSCLRLYFKG